MDIPVSLPFSSGITNAHGLGSASGGGDDVASSGTAAAPVLLGGAVNGLLGSGGGVNGGHQALDNAELVVDNAWPEEPGSWWCSSRWKRSSCPWCRCPELTPHYEHGSGLVLRGSGDNNLLRAADEVLGSALFVGANTPVASAMYSAPDSAHGISAGSLQAYTHDRIAVNDQLAVS